MSKSKGSPRKFSEKIALLNKKGAEGTAAFEQIIKEVEETTRASFSYSSQASSISSWTDDRTCADELQLQPQHHQHHQQPLQQPHHQHQAHLQQQQQPHLIDNNFGHYVTTGPTGSPSAALHVQQPHLLSPHSPQPDHQVSIQTPAGLPNIEIFPITDDAYTTSQQQVNHHHHHHNGNSINHSNNNATTTIYRNDCSNPISSARSLPDIANLRVSNTTPSLTFNPVAPSFSDQRIANEYDYSYDANCNIVLDQTLTQQPSTATTTGEPQQPSYYNHQHQTSSTSQQASSPTSANSWHIATYASPPDVVAPPTTTTNQSHPQQTSSLHQNYYLPHSQQTTTTDSNNTCLVRASSTNAVWDTAASNTLNAPLISNNLSKSSEGCYGYLNDNLSTSIGYCDNSFLASDQQQQPASIPLMMRSRSYNNIEDIDVQGEGDKFPHQRYMQQAQHEAFGNSTDCQFYQ